MKNRYHVISAALILLIFFAAQICYAAGGKASITVTVSDGPGHRASTMGVAPGATDCIDPALGEYELAPAPPLGIFDSRFIEPGCVPALQGLSVDYHGGSLGGDTTGSFLMAIQKDTTLPILLTLSPGWPAVFGSLEIYDDPTGGVNTLDVVMSANPERDTLTLGYFVTAHGTTTYHDVTRPAILYSARTFGIIATQFSIISTAGANGVVTPTGNTQVDSGASQIFMFTPNSGYIVDSVIVDNSPVIAAASYTFSDVIAGHTIRVVFAAAAELADTTTVWNLQVTAEAEGLSDNDHFLGAGTSATDGFDSLFDTPEPPQPAGNFVQLYFPHPEFGEPTGSNFARDIRAVHAIGDTVIRWFFDVGTNLADTTVTLNFLSDGRIPPGAGMMLFDLTNGARKNLRSAGMNYAYRTGANAVNHFEIMIGDSTPPTAGLLSPAGGIIVRSNGVFDVEWASADRMGIDSTVLGLSLDSAHTYQRVAALYGAQHSYSWSVPQAYLNSGASFEITVYDSMGNATSVFTDYLFTLVGDSLSVTFPAGWNLIGSPLKPADSTLSAVFSAAVQTPYVFAYSPGSGYEPPAFIEQGAGYWLGALQPYAVTFRGAAVTDSAVVDLPQGFDMIANPLVVPVSKENLLFSNAGRTVSYDTALADGWISAGLQAYDNSTNSYANADTLSLWQGCWIGVLDSGVQMTVKPPSNVPASAAKRVAKRQQLGTASNWQVNITATMGRSSDRSLVFGVGEDATDGFDVKYDEPKPPSPPGGNYVEAYFVHADWAPVLGSKFVAQINSARTILWSFTVAPSQNGSVTLSWNASLVKAGVPDSIHLYLKDEGNGTVTDMRAASSYQVSVTGTRAFTISTNPLGVRRGAGIPAQFALRQNYPNPFNPTTTIRYELPRLAFVHLSLFNELGQEVWVLVNQTEQAGYQSVEFDGDHLASGMYIYRLTAGNFSDVKKMVLIK